LPTRRSSDLFNVLWFFVELGWNRARGWFLRSELLEHWAPVFGISVVLFNLARFPIHQGRSERIIRTAGAKKPVGIGFCCTRERAAALKDFFCGFIIGKIGRAHV